MYLSRVLISSFLFYVFQVSIRFLVGVRFDEKNVEYDTAEP